MMLALEAAVSRQHNAPTRRYDIVTSGSRTPILTAFSATYHSAIFRHDMPILRPSRPLAILTVWVWLVTATLLSASNTAVAEDSPVRSIDVNYADGVYVLDAVMLAPVAQSVAWDVLTDFDHMAQWVPNVSDSKILQRDDTSVTIEQRGVAKYGAATFPYTTDRKLVLNPPNMIKSNQLRGSLRRVESTMLLEPEGKGTRLVYHLEIVPSFLAAAILTKPFLEHEVSEQFTAIIAEMVRRAR